MKKAILCTLVLVMLLSLAACGSKEETPAAPTAAPAAAEAPAEPTEVPAEVPEPAAEADALDETIALVKSLIAHDVAELYEAIGEPESSDYGSSCLVQGGQDGQLFYDGFTVYTLVQADGTETVYDVE